MEPSAGRLTLKNLKNNVTPLFSLCLVSTECGSTLRRPRYCLKPSSSMGTMERRRFPPPLTKIKLLTAKHGLPRSVDGGITLGGEQVSPSRTFFCITRRSARLSPRPCTCLRTSGTKAHHRALLAHHSHHIHARTVDAESPLGQQRLVSSFCARSLTEGVRLVLLGSGRANNSTRVQIG